MTPIITRSTILAVLAGAALTLASCGGGAEPGAREPSTTATRDHAAHDHSAHDHGAMQAEGGAMACPMMLESAQVSVEDTADGVAMTFTTDRSEDVAPLRERVRAMRVRAMSAMHERHAAGGGMGEMPPATVAVTEVANGARLELTASDPADVGALRQHASAHAEHMRDRRGCPMMGGASPPA